MENQINQTCSLEYQAIVNSLESLSKEELLALEHELDKRLHVCNGCSQIIKSMHACPGRNIRGDEYHPEYTLILEMIDNRLPVMKILREDFYLSLNDMQIALHNLPYIVMTSSSKKEIDFYKEKFDNVGAAVKVTFSTNHNDFSVCSG